MNKKEEWQKKLEEEAIIPEIVWAKAEESFQIIQNKKEVSTNIQADRKSRRRQTGGKKRTGIIILVAILMISTLTAGAGVYLHWNINFKEQYEVSPKIEKKLNDLNAAKEIDQYVENDGLRIEAVQSVADSYTAHIILKIKGNKEIPISKNYNFGNVEVKVEDNDKISYTAGFLETQETEDYADGVAYQFLIQDSGGKGLLNKDVTLIFTNVVDSYTGKINGIEPPILINARWELTVPLENEDSGTVYEVNKQIPGSDAFVKKLRLSSISYTLELDWRFQTEIVPAVDENGVESTFEHTVSSPGLVGVVYADGSSSGQVIHIMEGHFLTEDFRNGELAPYEQSGYNTKLIEYENVTELIFYINGEEVRVPVEK